MLTYIRHGFVHLRKGRGNTATIARPMWEFMACLEGEMAPLVKQGQTPAAFSGLTLWVFPRWYPHGWQTDGRCERAVFHFSMVPAELEKHVPARGYYAVSLAPADAHRLREDAEAAVQWQAEPSELEQLQNDTILGKLSLMALREGLPLPLDNQQLAKRKTTAALSWYAANMHERPRLERMAREVQVSPSYLRRLMHQATGMSPKKAMARIQLESAAHLICQSSLTMEAAAERVGLSSASSLSRAMKRHFGCKPGELRNTREMAQRVARRDLSESAQMEDSMAVKEQTVIRADVPGINRQYAAHHVQRHNMAGFRAPKIDTVRVGVIGMKRGDNHIKALVQIEGVEVRAICDTNPLQVDKAMAWFEGTDHRPEIYTDGEDEWKKLCERKDLDLVFVCTPIPMHAKMSLYAMRQGKHVCSEVAATWTMEECWELVKTAEETQKHFMMMENYSYMDFHLVTINMAYQGFYGDIVHAEGAYNTSKERPCFRKIPDGYSDMWWLREFGQRRGIIYPTHGLGPIATCLDINRGDRMDYLVYVEGNDFTFGPTARRLAKEDPFYEEFVDLPYRGNMGVALIRTVKGKTMMVQHDPYTPTPHNLIHGIYGTKGAALFDPGPPRFSKGDHCWYTQGGKRNEEYVRLFAAYTPEIYKRTGHASRGHGHGGSDLRMDWHIIDCLRNGLPMPQDVYDAAAWSSLVPLTSWSAQNRSNSIDIPDFTCGAWETNPRNMDINLENGGGNTKILPPSEAGMKNDDHLARQWARDHELKG